MMLKIKKILISVGVIVFSQFFQIQDTLASVRLTYIHKRSLPTGLEMGMSAVNGPVGPVMPSVMTFHGDSIAHGINGVINFYLIFYGDWSRGNRPSSVATIQQFITDFGTSPLLRSISNYWDNTGPPATTIVLAGTVMYSDGPIRIFDDTTDPDPYPSDVSHPTIGLNEILENLWNSSRLPVDDNAIYAILPSADVYQSQPATDGFHGGVSFTDLNGNTHNMPLIFSASANARYNQYYSGSTLQALNHYIPNLPGMGTLTVTPNNDNEADSAIDTLGHEILEALTDQGRSWFRDSDLAEVCDLCYQLGYPRHHYYGDFGTTGNVQVFSTSNGSFANMTLNGHNYLLEPVFAKGNTAQASQGNVTSVRGSCALDIVNSPGLYFLGVNGISLTPAFVRQITAYSGNIPFATSSVTLAPVLLALDDTVVTVNGNPVISGLDSAPISMQVGLNTIPVVVIPPSGTPTTYTVSITRTAPSSVKLLSALSVSGAPLVPAFSSANTAYTVSVPYAVSSVAITPTVLALSNATVSVNGRPVNSGHPSAQISLLVGTNIIPVLVTAEDGTQNTYRITVVRDAPRLSALILSNPSSGPNRISFNSNVFSYTVSVGVNEVYVTPTLSSPSGGITTAIVNGVTVNSGSTSRAIPVSVGSNTIAVKVSGGGATTTYTLTVNRQKPR